MLKSSEFVLELAEEAVAQLLGTYAGMTQNLGFDMYGAEDYAKKVICEQLELTDNELDAILNEDLEVEEK